MKWHQVGVFSDWNQARKSARAWLNRAKAQGTVVVLGGGWWRIIGWRKPVQGLDALAIQLLGRGVINPDGTLKGRVK